MFHELQPDAIRSNHIRIYCNIEKLYNKKNQKFPVIILIRIMFYSLLFLISKAIRGFFGNNTLICCHDDICLLLQIFKKCPGLK